MRVQALQLSNILSFEFKAQVTDAFNITFDPTLNIIIGGNGSGKSTALEALNFIFRRVLFKHYAFRQDQFEDTRAQYKKNTLSPDNQSGRISPFRLQPNWQTESNEQKIKLVITLDDIDKANIQNVIDNYDYIKSVINKYSSEELPAFTSVNGDESIDITVTFSGSDDSYAANFGGATGGVQFYLEKYFLLNEAISIHNKANTTNRVDKLNNTFSMLSAFRNYTSFSQNTSLQSDPLEQFRSIRQNNANLSNNQGGEPSIFNAVKLRLGEQHYEMMQGEYSVEDATKKVNELDVVKKINEKLSILNLQFSIEAKSTRNWAYEFRFYDIKHQRDMGDINSLSAGQKSIIHLIFEAYGQDDMKGGVVIIDEPEIHLHYQFQYEYLRILEELAAEQKTQYILVTHSEGFINSVTATYIKRFSLDDSRYSEVHAPRLTANQQKLIEILDNTQAARALFANKVLLVEGQDDEYFFRSALKSKAPELRQEIAIYNAHSKNSIQSWKEFFEAFGVTVYFIKDLDAVAKDIYGEADVSLKTSESITDFINSHTDLIDKIYAQYASGGFYLKAGALEQYTQKAKGIKNVIEFCDHIDSYLADGSDNSKEIITILDNIIK